MSNSDFQTIFNQLSKECEQLSTRLDFSNKHRLLSDYQNQIAQAGFWQKSDAQAIQKKYKVLNDSLKPYLDLNKCLDNYKQTLDLINNIEHKDLVIEFKKLENQARKQLSLLRKQLQFNYPYADHQSVLISFLAGAGGTDAQDWTQMLFRMYSRWAEHQNLKQTIISQSFGDEAGLKSVSLQLEYNP
ncbi:MAG: PCRF domain-containing protein [Candidatus Saccharibacteria bacterium]|nr:PCRF domain-containing protein [Candidatus Saccharibacteria bacterium]